MDYLADEGSRPVAGVYASGATRVAFAMVTSDRGDIRELLDVNGVAFAHYAYDAYGNPTATLTAATTAVPAAVARTIAARQVLRYAGYTWDAESSLYYCSQRYYDPRTACFLSKDPARADGEESAYQYCGGDPVGGVDPTGLWTWGFNWYPMRQQGKNWCWAAAAVTAIQAVTGKWVAQREFVRRTYWGLTPHIFAFAWQVSGTLTKFGVKAKLHLGWPKHGKHLRKALKKNRVVLMAHNGGLGRPAHMTALYWASKWKSDGKVRRSVRVMDPAIAGEYSGSYKDYKKTYGSTNAWIEVWK